MPNFCARLRNFSTAQSWAGRRTIDDANATGTCEALRRGKGGGSDKGSGRDDFEDGGVVDVALVLAVRCSALRYASATRSPAWPLQRIRRRLPQHFAAVRFPRPREPQPRVCSLVPQLRLRLMNTSIHLHRMQRRLQQLRILRRHRRQARPFA